MTLFNKTVVIEFINKWIPLLETIEKDETLKNRCKKYNAYIPSEDDESLLEELHFYDFLQEGYNSGIVVQDYTSFSDGKEELIDCPTDGFIKNLS